MKLRKIKKKRLVLEISPEAMKQRKKENIMRIIVVLIGLVVGVFLVMRGSSFLISAIVPVVILLLIF